jgi:transposase
MIQAPKVEHRIMRYELSDCEWGVIKPMLPNKPRGIPRVDDRRVFNDIFWVLRSGAPWRDLPETWTQARWLGHSGRRQEDGAHRLGFK